MKAETIRIRKYIIIWWLRRGAACLLIAGVVVMMGLGDAPVPAQTEKPMVTVLPISAVSQNIDSHTYYDVPLTKQEQAEIQNMAAAAEVPYEMVLAVMEQESGFRADAIGDGGRSIGLMQVQPRWTEVRMARLGVDDLTNPLQNAKTGIAILSDKIAKYGDHEKALVAYNAGDVGSAGVYSNAYSQSVLNLMEKYYVK